MPVPPSAFLLLVSGFWLLTSGFFFDQFA